MRHVLTGIAVGALALGLVSLTPDTASAKRNYGWGWSGGPGVNIYIGPRHSYEPRYKYRKYVTASIPAIGANPTATGPATNIVTRTIST